MSPKSFAIEGSIVALPTPYRDEAVDLAGLDRLVEFQSRHATSGVVVGGATGEGWSLSSDEMGQLVGRAAESAAHHSRFRLHVYAGIVGCDSRRGRDLARAAVQAGADGVIVSAPAFARPSSGGILRHFATIAEGLPARTPIVMMNEPQRTGTDIGAAVAQEIVDEIPSVVAHCEGLGRPARARRLPFELPVPVLCGDDRMIGPYVRNGAKGAITAVGNLVPGEVAALIEALQARDHRADARERQLSPLIDALRIAGHPVPLKEALGALEAISSDVRPPLVGLTPGDLAALEQALFSARLLVPAH